MAVDLKYIIAYFRRYLIIFVWKLLFILIFLSISITTVKADPLVKTLNNPDQLNNNLVNTAVYENNVKHVDKGIKSIDLQNSLSDFNSMNGLQNNWLKAEDKDDLKTFKSKDIETSYNINDPTDETATVHTVRFFFQAIFDTEQPGNTTPGGDYVPSKIHKIIIDHDLDFGVVADKTTPEDANTANYFNFKSRNNTGDAYKYVHTIHDHLVIDGQGHTINLGNCDIALQKPSMGSIHTKKIDGLRMLIYIVKSFTVF